MRTLVVSAAFVCIVALCMAAESALADPSADGTIHPCQTVNIVSPNGRWALVTESNGCACNESHSDRRCVPELYLKDRQGDRKQLAGQYAFGGTAAWSPDSSAFFVNDHLTSDRDEAYLYETQPLVKTDLRKALLKADPSIARFMDAHRYVLAKRWLDNHTVLVEFCGHTDQAPVVQFDDLFHVGLDGSARQVSKRENLSPYVPACAR
jgi:hypothetical protein